MSNPVWLVRVIEKTFPARFKLARMTRIPLLGRLIEGFLFQGDDIVYLPQNRSIPINESVESENIILPSEVIEHFIDKANYLWVMNECICRKAEGCKDFPHDLGCLFMGEAAMGINPRLGRRVSRDEAREHMARCREAGLFQMIGRNKLDTRWLNVKPGDKLLTVCFCCPCCCLWRMLPELEEEIAAKVHRMPGVEVRVTDECVGCGTCVREEFCFVRAIQMEGERAVIAESCRGCGNCVRNCPNQAIELTITESDFKDQLIARISALVDVE
jgi:ferredoxin